MTRLTSIGRGTRVGWGAAESPDVVSHEATREAGAFREWLGTCVGRGAAEWKFESPDVVSYG